MELLVRMMGLRQRRASIVAAGQREAAAGDLAGAFAGLARHGVEQVAVGHTGGILKVGIWERHTGTQRHRLPTRRDGRRAGREPGRWARPT